MSSARLTPGRRVAYLGAPFRIAKSMARKPAAKTARPKAAKTAPAAVATVADTAEVIEVRSHRVACDGGGGALGHPRVWLEMGEAAFVECPYCDRRFVLAAGSEGAEDERLPPGVYQGAPGH